MSKRAIERWNLLKTSGKGDGALEVPSIDSGVETGYGTARYAIDAHGQPRLLVPIAGIYAAKGLASTSKLVVTTSTFKVGGKNKLYIDIISQERALDPVFAELAEEILRRIKGGGSPQDSIIKSIEDFRELLKEELSENIPENKILGVIGELEVVRRLSTYHNSAIETWVGPYEQRHDFRRGIHALEVKTSSRSDVKKVSIHGIDQLSPPNGGVLHLVHVRIERVQGGPLSVRELYKNIISLGVNPELLHNCLKLLGCNNPLSNSWNYCSFSLEGISVYAVIDGFPRIIDSSFIEESSKEGISSLRYDIDLSTAYKFEVSKVEIDKIFSGVAIK